MAQAIQFQSTPSARRATEISYDDELEIEISIHALREEGDHGKQAISHRQAISIHALREEGDADALTDVFSRIKISIHALREEGDSKSGEKIHHVCSIIHTCAQFEKELYEGSGEMQNKSC